MAFEFSNPNPKFTTYITQYGVENILKNNFNVGYFSLSDGGINYKEITDGNLLPNGFVPTITGDLRKTDYNGLFSPIIYENQSETNIIDRNLVFIRDCDENGLGTEHINLDVTINIGNYLMHLRDGLTTNNFNFKTFINIFDKVQVRENSEYATGTKYISNVWMNKPIHYDFLTEKDYQAYWRFVRSFINKNILNQPLLVETNSVNKFRTPFQLSFNTGLLPGGQLIPGAGPLTFFPYWDEIGYWVNGKNFLTIQDLEGSNLEEYRTIIPAVKFNNIPHPLVGNWDKNFKYQQQMSLLRWEGIIDTWQSATLNLFNFYGKEYTSGMKVITLNLKANTNGFDDNIKTNPSYIRLNFILDMNPNNWNNNNIIQYT